MVTRFDVKPHRTVPYEVCKPKHVLSHEPRCILVHTLGREYNWSDEIGNEGIGIVVVA